MTRLVAMRPARSILRDGETIAYDTGGQGERAIVFAHNLMCDRGVFAAEAERLSAAARTINVDLRGHGASTAHAPYSIADLGDDILAILDAETIEGAVIVGLSLGASAAMHLAVTRPERVRGIALLSPCGTKPGRAESVRDAVAVRAIKSFGIGDRLSRTMVAALFGSTFRAESPDVVLAFATNVRAMPPLFASHALRAWSGRPNAIDDLGRVHAPSIVVAGEEDEPNPPAEAERVAAALPGARLVRIERCGHTMPIERPAAIAAALDAFLASVDAPLR